MLSVTEASDSLLPQMIRTGIGFDVHKFAEGRRLVLGGVEIPHVNGLDGHSDADVLVHAVMDALLGASALGDIGTHFPPDDPKWKDANSIKLMEKVRDILKSNKVTVYNVDAMIIAEQPRLASYTARMRANIAAALEVTEDRVGVKATTMEGLGPIGRSEGIAVMAVACIEKAEK